LGPAFGPAFCFFGVAKGGVLLKLQFWLFPWLLIGAPGITVEHESTLERGEVIRGAARTSQGQIATWGANLRLWTLPELRSRTVAQGPFGEGGCLVDLDGDGAEEFVSVLGEGLGRLVWLRPPVWKPETIDTDIETHDCIAATLFGRKGILIIHRGAQVRFYERATNGSWNSRDIYSIYTPSYQAGLALRDVDRDGRTDIFCGNYWIRSPERFELAWRLFAINTWFEKEESATMRLLPVPEGIVMAQAHMDRARVALFRKPADPRQQWPAAGNGEFSKVHGLAQWSGRILAGEAEGRLFAWEPGGITPIAEGRKTVAIIPVDAARFVAVGPESVTLWRQDSRR
jgi:hypothetical protein